MIRRGDVYYADLSPVVGSEQGGVRPVVVVQNDKGNRYSKTIIVAPISKKMSKPPIPTHVIFSDDSLSYVSMILCEQLRTIDKKRLGQWICTLDEKTLEKINRAIRVSLSIGMHEGAPYGISKRHCC
ncbi:MAG: type II toxin-antitoxin system PemK/MazF family toxin [Longicatena caecimuris]